MAAVIKGAMTGAVTLRPMTAADLAEASRVWRLAFGTQFGAPDPTRFRLEVRSVETRFATNPDLCFVAERDGSVVGSVIGMDWGSQIVLGPLTVDPASWGQGIARLLTARFLEAADARRAPLVSLFTFPQSTTHVRLYESFGFAPMHLTPILTKAAAQPTTDVSHRLFQNARHGERSGLLEQCRAIAVSNLAGLDLSREIEAVDRQILGDTILTEAEGAVAGFAICHTGAGEAGKGNMFVKFASVRPRDAAAFERLVDAVERVATERGLERITFGINTARRDAYRRVIARGYRASLIGVAMHRPDTVGTLRRELYVIDDYR
jgi:predicted N-acetyltransferase YhbS